MYYIHIYIYIYNNKNRSLFAKNVCSRNHFIRQQINNT